VTSEPTVFVVDDDMAIRRAIAALLDSVGLRAENYASAEEFLLACDPQRPGCLVLDVRMHGMSGLVLQDRLAGECIQLPIIFISGHADISATVRAMKAHAFDFIEKPFNQQRLLEAVHAAIQWDARARQVRAELAQVSARLASLTQREQEVLDLILNGSANKVIASTLGVSPKTVETHRAHIMQKMEARSVAGLMRMMLRVQAQQGHKPAQ
jgi:two-component system response regulator FixJ